MGAYLSRYLNRKGAKAQRKPKKLFGFYINHSLRLCASAVYKELLKQRRESPRGRFNIRLSEHAMDHGEPR
jgi:hypothetical protein